MSKESTVYSPEDIINKKAITIGEYYLGNTKEVGEDYILIETTTHTRGRRPRISKYYVPKTSLDHFHPDTVYFKITYEEMKQYKRD
jgi:hypothetical protein